MNARQRARVLEALRKGHYVVVACQQAGISRASYYDWTQKDPTFAEETAKAKSDAEDACLGAIMADPSWQARAWVMERRYGKRWAKKTPDVVVQQVHAAQSVQLPADPAERVKVLEALTERERGKLK